jgi:hypothetical protein
MLDDPQAAEPVEFTTRRECLFAPAGTTLRGYRGGRYRFTPLAGNAAEYELADDWYRHGNAVGGRLQLHFAAQPVLMRGLFTRPQAQREGYAGVG